MKSKDNIDVKPFHKTFPYGLEWSTIENKKTLQHFAYFPYDDYRDRYSKKLKRNGIKNIRKFATKKRTN